MKVVKGFEVPAQGGDKNVMTPFRILKERPCHVCPNKSTTVYRFESIPDSIGQTTILYVCMLCLTTAATEVIKEETAANKGAFL